jgi:hypothetical protein
MQQKNTRIIWPGGHKNSIYAEVIRHDSRCWEVIMRDRFTYRVSVTSTCVHNAWKQARLAIA